ncbi:hypothetical protein AMAG_13190 [Allomyces macrogynus ATCC 38327]|uniref:F-box domain-containing protein n=1 Tax=Allomyces macrogynus (strain ATCC 38327) TaxID=578462 RepID=A0A0L0SZV4_ALLM3|nr:hypothetical protein AMAG_13190 [Allomyces macrogynus ATCC 38327]|eukprot:KNE68016.1 hypothetical protein AMAG_13190 [Allomyces macrogynus ATCC 38327]
MALHSLIELPDVVLAGLLNFLDAKSTARLQTTCRMLATFPTPVQDVYRFNHALLAHADASTILSFVHQSTFPPRSSTLASTQLPRIVLFMAIDAADSDLVERLLLANYVAVKPVGEKAFRHLLYRAMFAPAGPNRNRIVRLLWNVFLLMWIAGVGI